MMQSSSDMSQTDVNEWNRWRGEMGTLVRSHDVALKEVQAALQQILLGQIELKNYFGKILFRAAGSALAVGIILGIAFKEVLPWLAKLLG